MTDAKLTKREECAFCGDPAQGNYSIHRDGYCEGPEVPLCDRCGGEELPTLETIWGVISSEYPRSKTRQRR